MVKGEEIQGQEIMQPEPWKNIEVIDGQNVPSGDE